MDRTEDHLAGFFWLVAFVLFILAALFALLCKPRD